MALLKRRTAAAGADPADADAPDTVTTVEDEDGRPAQAAKGRPTPKRSEARAARGRPGSGPAPRNSKGARAGTRNERRRQSQEYRAAMMSGDVAKLPPRERAPERILARDYIDARRNVGPFFLLTAAVYFVGGLVPNGLVRVIAAYLMLAGILAVVVDSIILSRQVMKRVREAYPDSTLKVRAYAVQRALMPRRWRLPRPRTPRGTRAPSLRKG
jgi:hypothetical protein